MICIAIVRNYLTYSIVEFILFSIIAGSNSNRLAKCRQITCCNSYPCAVSKSVGIYKTIIAAKSNIVCFTVLGVACYVHIAAYGNITVPHMYTGAAVTSGNSCVSCNAAAIHIKCVKKTVNIYSCSCVLGYSAAVHIEITGCNNSGSCFARIQRVFDFACAILAAICKCKDFAVGNRILVEIRCRFGFDGMTVEAQHCAVCRLPLRCNCNVIRQIVVSCITWEAVCSRPLSEYLFISISMIAYSLM